MKNTIHKRAHGGAAYIHRILLSHNDLHAREGVKHDLEKYFFFEVKEYQKNTTLLFKSIQFTKRPYFTL